MLIHRKGNLIDLAEAGEFQVIVHGCNCLNTMGSGIAREIRERHPGAYEADTALTSEIEADGNSQVQKLGRYSTYLITKPTRFLIVNAYTQIGFSPRNMDHFEYASFEVILKKMAHEYGPFKIGFPRIGQGLAGGNPERINKMLGDFAVSVHKQGGTVTVVDFDGK